MKKYVQTAGLIILIIVSWYFLRISGQDYKKIHSNILEETRAFLVHLPEGYETSNERYPVLYLLDGGNVKIHSRDITHYTRAVATLKELANTKMPKLILVGIANTNRTRDMLPVKVNLFLDGGGADFFLRFLREELVPYIDRHYRTTSYRILYGMSDSGLFAIYALLTAPDSFSAYISSSPSLGYCPLLIGRKAEELFETNKTLEKHLYIIYGSKDIPYCAPAIPPFVELLKKWQMANFRWEVKVAKGEGHIPLSSLQDGLEFIFCLKK
jgi:uncharacterized protein